MEGDCFLSWTHKAAAFFLSLAKLEKRKHKHKRETFLAWVVLGLRRGPLDGLPNLIELLLAQAAAPTGLRFWDQDAFQRVVLRTVMFFVSGAAI